MSKIWTAFGILFLLLAWCCSSEPEGAVFTELSKTYTGVDFRNLLNENEDFNIFKYQYFNNGGGVAIGDFNNDGLQDIVFTGNMVKNRLYINQGGLKFEDHTLSSGIAEKEGWCTGVTTVDINQDGWLDMYICRAAYPFENLRSNLLFINNGDLTFSERAAEFGLDDIAHSTHSSFFDYDRDGDLDLFLLNHSTVEYSRGNLDVVRLQHKEEPENTNKLFRNENGTFIDVSAEAGIASNVLTFSLGLAIADINNDGWPDIYIGNDFHESDYLFINQGDGTFIDEASKYFDHTSMFSMGVDIADFDQDGWQDIVSLDMLPRTHFQQKVHAGLDNYERARMLADNGFGHQFSRNMLQKNNGDGSFSEIGQMAGVSNTNWSWAPLFFDFDNDGYKDLFVGNGYPRDHTDMDFLNFTANEVIRIDEGQDTVSFEEYMAEMPPIDLPNFFYLNEDNHHFTDMATDWGIDQSRISQSAAYADLDNDGDLDLVLNNTADHATIYRNNSEKISNSHFLSVDLHGQENNPQAIGAKVRLFHGEQCFLQEQQLVRGFQSSVDPVMHFGLGAIDRIDSLIVEGPTGQIQKMYNVPTDQRLVIELGSINVVAQESGSFTRGIMEETALFDFSHEEDFYNDFNTQFLLPWTYSSQGTALAVEDVNGDGREDVFCGNGKDGVASLLLQQEDGQFISSVSTSALFEQQRQFEDSDALFADFNQDGRPDLYLASGSYEFPSNSQLLQDRLLINMGDGLFEWDQEALPELRNNTNCVAAADADADGDIDLFVGGGYQHGAYPECSPSYLLLNDGNARFSKAPVHTFNTTDAEWVDLNQDGNLELITLGEWGRIEVYGLVDNAVFNYTDSFFLEPKNGLWSSLNCSDLDGDGDIDIIAGNLGQNSQLTASREEPLQLVVDDFDKNGSLDPLLFYFLEGGPWPYFSRDDYVNQLPAERNKYLHFRDYAVVKLEEMLTEEQLSAAEIYQVHTLATTCFENVDGQLIERALPAEVQMAPVHAIELADLNGDEWPDLILGGNTLQARVSLGRLNANHGLALLGSGEWTFSALSSTASGLLVRGKTTDLDQIQVGDDTHLLFGRNKASLMTYKIK